MEPGINKGIYSLKIAAIFLFAVFFVFNLMADTPTFTPTATQTGTPTTTATPNCCSPGLFGLNYTYSNNGGSPIGQMAANQYQLSVNAMVASVSIYIDYENGDGMVMAGIYTDNGSNAPLSLVASTNAVSPTASGWLTLPFTSNSVLSQGYYWIVMQTTGNVTLDYTTGATEVLCNNTFGSFTSPWPSVATSNWDYSMYVNYCPMSCYTNTMTPTFTNTFTITATNTPSPTPTMSDTSTPSISPTATKTNSATGTPTSANTASDTPTGTRTVTGTATPSITPTRTITLTITDTGTKTATGTNTPSLTATKTFTISPTLTSTFTLPPSPSSTPSVTPSVTITSSVSSTPTITQTDTQTQTTTMTITLTLTASSTITSTVTQTITPMPPEFTLLKVTTPTNNIASNNLTFTLQICNNGGIVTQNFTVIDDWSSSTPQDNWQFNGPFFISSPANGITSISGSGSNTSATFVIAPSEAGFTGCFSFPVILTMYTGVPENSSWNNNASLGFQGMPSVVSTIDLSDLCATFTVTVTPTYTDTSTITTTDTYTSTPTWTATDTPTWTVTYTNTSTLTSSPTLTATDTASATPTFTSSISDTPTFTVTDTVTPTSTYSATVTYTNTLTATYTETGTLTITQTETISSTPSITATYTISPTYTITPEPNSNMVLSKNYVYPEKGETLEISVKAAANVNVKIKVYNLTGEMVRRNMDFTTTIDGWNQVSWDIRNDDGKFVGEGLYFVYIDAGGNKKLLKVYIVK